MRADRDPYTDATLARAIRDGIDADGRPLSYLMPHFQLDDAQMAALIAYLKSALAGPSRPASPIRCCISRPSSRPKPIRQCAQGVLDVLTKFFDDKNHYTRAESPRLHSSRRMMFKVNRRWQLHVWQLTGAPETWEAQLRAKLAATPVFAVISGVGGHTWAPVHHFCEAAELPCLFPNVDLPVDRESDFDTLYLSKGVLLEAQLIAQAIRDRQEKESVTRVVQIFRAGDVGVEAAAALDTELRRYGLAVVNRSLGAKATHSELRERIDHSLPGDLLVLWLRAPDLRHSGRCLHMLPWRICPAAWVGSSTPRSRPRGARRPT